MLINQFSVQKDIYLGDEQKRDANQNSVRIVEHQQYWATHSSRAMHATTKRNRKFANNNVTFVMSTTALRDRRLRPPNRNNGDDRHRRPSSLRDRRQQRHQHHRRHQQKMIIWKNVIIETWAKLFGGGYFAPIRKNEHVSMDSDRGGVSVST